MTNNPTSSPPPPNSPPTTPAPSSLPSSTTSSSGMGTVPRKGWYLLSFDVFSLLCSFFCACGCCVVLRYEVILLLILARKTGAVFRRYFAGYRFWQGKPVRHLEGCRDTGKQ